MRMRTTFLHGLILAVAVAGGSGAAHSVAAHRAMPAVAGAPNCAVQIASFTVQISQGISVFSPKRLVVDGSCFATGAFISVWDITANVSLTNGWHFLPSAATGKLTYVVSGALCNHRLMVVMQDIAHNTRAIGDEKAYGPCQTPRPALEQGRASSGI